MCSCMVDALRLSLRRPPAPSSPTRGLLRRWRRAGVVFVRLCPRATPPLRWLSSSRGLPLDGLPILELAPARAAPHLLVLLSRHHALGKVRPLGKSDGRAVRLHRRPVENGACKLPYCACMCAHDGRAGGRRGTRQDSLVRGVHSDLAVDWRERPQFGEAVRAGVRVRSEGREAAMDGWTGGRAASSPSTHSLWRKPGIAVLPPIKPIFAQKRPCRSSGRSAMLAATVALSPACSSPAREHHKSNRRERRFRGCSHMEGDICRYRSDGRVSLGPQTARCSSSGFGSSR